MITYGLYWNKPQRVFTPTIFFDSSSCSEETREQILNACENGRLRGFRSTMEVSEWQVLSGAIAGAIGAAIFGGIHVLAWNFAFPTTIELICWRCASVYLTIVSLASVPLAYLEDHSSKTVETGVDRLVNFFLCLYIVARLFILVEIFRTLFFLPAGSFVSTWSTNLPHFS